jgi:hypothetical protein
MTCSITYISTIALSLLVLLHDGFNNNSYHAVNGFAVIVPYSNHQRQPFVSTSTTLFAKRVSFKEDARRGLVSGINQVADAVRVTLGPKVTPMDHFLSQYFPENCQQT